MELFKGNTKFGDEVIYQKLVLKVELPEISFQGGTISRPYDQNSIFNLGTEMCLCSTSEPSCSNLCLFIRVVWNRSNWERSTVENESTLFSGRVHSSGTESGRPRADFCC